MPVMNGWALPDQLAGSARLRAIPVIVTSAFEGLAPIPRVKAFLPKPLHLATLPAVLAEDTPP
jgi:hypothetical protein